MKKIIFLIILGLFIPVMTYAAKNGDIKEGNRLYTDGEFAKSLEKYKEVLAQDPEADIVNFNTAAAYYKTEDYENAVTHFRKALLGSDDSIKANTYYNLGNAQYKQGLIKEKQDLSAAVGLLESSLQDYEKALNLNAEDESIKANHSYVTQELQRLKKELEKQQKEKDKPCPLPPKDDKESDQQKKKSSQEKKSQQEKNQTNEQEDNQSQAQNKNDQQEQLDQKQQSPEEKQGDEKENQQQGSQKQEQEKDTDENNKPQNPQEMSDQEYQMLLKNYQQNEEPKGLLNMQPRSMRIRNVDKDW